MLLYLGEEFTNEECNKMCDSCFKRNTIKVEKRDCLEEATKICNGLM